MDVNPLIIKPPYIRFILILLFLVAGIYIIKGQIQISEISRNWNDNRCKPHIMPFASLYGYDTVENFNYCLHNIFKGQSGQTLGPLFQILSVFGTVLGTLLGSLNNLRLQGASLYGGITQIFTEFTTRIAQLTVKIRTTSIRIRSLMNRVQTTMFAIMYMGLSGINAAASFSDTVLFKFLDTFCFPPDTPIKVIDVDTGKIETIPIKNLYVGQKLINGNQVTSTFEFYVENQPMVTLHNTTVSSNHYVFSNTLKKFVKAKDHPDALEAPSWTGKLICLNCTNHRFEIDRYTFLDYDETEKGDNLTMSWIEDNLNCEKKPPQSRKYDYTTVIARNTNILTSYGPAPIDTITLNEQLPTGKVIGIVKKICSEICITALGSKVSPATLLWIKEQSKWIRAGDLYPIEKIAPTIYMSLIVLNTGTIELESGDIIRDYVEIHSPDSEQFYTKIINEDN